jgi:hypothetical protein
VIRADFDQRLPWQPASPDQFFGIGERDHVVCPAVQDHRAGLHRLRRPIFFPCRAKQDELGSAAVDVHRHGPASARSHDDLGLVLIELGLGDADGFRHVVVRELRIDDGVAVLGEVRRLDAAWDRLPAVQEKDFHEVEPSFSLRQFGQYHGAGVLTGFGLRLRHMSQTPSAQVSPALP